MVKGRKMNFVRRIFKVLLSHCNRGHIRIVYTFSGSHCILLDAGIYVLYLCVVRC